MYIGIKIHMQIRTQYTSENIYMYIRIQIHMHIRTRKLPTYVCARVILYVCLTRAYMYEYVALPLCICVTIYTP